MQISGYIYTYVCMYDSSNNFENFGLLIWDTGYHENETYDK